MDRNPEWQLFRGQKRPGIYPFITESFCSRESRLKSILIGNLDLEAVQSYLFCKGYLIWSANQQFDIFIFY